MKIMKALALSTLLSACVDQPLEEAELGDIESHVAAIPGATYSMVHATGRCLDVAGFSRNPGQAMQGFACKSTGYLGNQQFTLESVTGGYRIRAYDSQLCLDLPNGSTADGTIVQQSQCHSGTNQVWNLPDAGSGTVSITTAMDAAKCMFLDAANTLRLSRCSSLTSAARNFTLGTTRTYASFRQGAQCLDLPSFSTANGVSPQLFGCKTTQATNQEWNLEPVSAGTFRLRSQNGGKCLDLRAGALTDGAVVEQQPCSTATSQRWRLLPQTASSYKLQNAASGKCADYYSGALRQYTCSTSYPSQLFEIQPGVAASLPSVTPSPTTTATAGSWAVDPNLVVPVMTGNITQESIIVRWTVSDPRIVEQRLTVWDEVPGVPGGPAPVVFVVPAQQRAFWIQGLSNQPLIAGHRYTVSLFTMSATGVSRSTSTTQLAGVMPGASVRVGIQPGNQTITPPVVETFAFLDDNNDGVVNGQAAGAGTFPRFPSGPSAASTVGNRFAQLGTVRANMIVGFLMQEGTAQQPHRTFVAAHVFINPITNTPTVTGVFYGDFDTTGRSQVWSGAAAVITNTVVEGDGGFAPNMVNGEVTAQVMANDGTFRVISFNYVLALDPA